MSKNMSQTQILERKGPKIDPFGTPYIISELRLRTLLIFAFYCLLERKFSMILRDWQLKPQTACSCKMQSKAFERSVNIAPLIPPLSKHFCHFSVIICVIKPLRYPHCHFKSIWLKYLYICLQSHLSYIFDKLGKMLIGQQFSTLFRSLFLKTEITSTFFNSEVKVVSNIESLRL